MAQVASRQLRNETRALLKRVEAGEEVTITVDGRPVAELVPLSRSDFWLSREELVRMLRDSQADPGLSADLADLFDETTDDLSFE
jgi:prevent-host-death family protein